MTNYRTHVSATIDIRQPQLTSRKGSMSCVAVCMLCIAVVDITADSAATVGDDGFATQKGSLIGPCSEHGFNRGCKHEPTLKLPA